jgi:hypothetical protein
MPPSWPAQAADVSTVLRSGLVAHGHDRPWPHEANKKSHREEIDGAKLQHEFFRFMF